MSTLSSRRLKRVYAFSILLFVLFISGLCSAQSLFSKYTAIKGKTATVILAKTYSLFTSKLIDNRHQSLFFTSNLSATLPQRQHSTTLTQSKLPTHAKETRTEHQRGAFRLAKLDCLDRLFLRYVILRGPLLQKGGSSPTTFSRAGGAFRGGQPPLVFSPQCLAPLHI